MRKIISVAVCAAMLAASLPAVPVFAESGSSQSESKETAAMKQAILEVKKRADIPKELDKFDYDSKTEYQTACYRFTWYREEKDENGRTYRPDSITVEYYNGFISSYSRNIRKNGTSKAHFQKLSPEKQDTLAKEYLYKLNPGLKGNPVIERKSGGYSINGGSASYSVTRTESKITVDKNSGRIEIDRDTGMLLNYSLSWWNDASIPDASKKLSESQVSDIYASRKPLKAYYDLFYRRLYDKEEKTFYYEPYAAAVYAPAVGGENEIDAITGEYTSLYDDMDTYSYTDMYEWDDYYDYYDDECCEDEEVDAGEGLAPAPDFNEEELKALEEENKYLSYEKCLKIIRDDKYIVFNKELILESNYLSSYTDEKGEYIPERCLSFKFTTSDTKKDSIYLSVNMDAYTGKIISFSKRYSYGKDSPNASRPAAQKSAGVKLAKEAAKHFAGSKAEKYVYDDNNVWNKDYSKQSLGFTRYENGLPVVFDTMKLTVDSNGEVLSYSCTYHEIDIPAANLIGEKEAYKKLFENMKPRLYYTGFTDLQLKSHTYLTYRFDPYYYINAITGERITNGGEPYYINDTSPVTSNEPKLYTDIKGHKYEKEITALWEYGVRITDNEKLDPDAAITIDEFLTLYSCLENGNPRNLYPEIKTYEGAEKKVVYVRNPMLDKPLTNGELAKIYVYRYRGIHFDTAGIEGIFAQPYKDVPASDKYCGYIAIAKATGLISDKDSFGISKKFTRANCLKAVYDYLCQDNEKSFYEIIRL